MRIVRRGAVVGLLVITVVWLLLVAGQPTGALPEYSSQTGEPCASCHISPSGGGLRTPRGQAWVGSGRPGVVPALNDALALLGVRLSLDEADFVALPGAIRPAEPLPVSSAHGEQMRAWLRMYAGN